MANLLVVDDAAFIRKLIGIYLQNTEFRVIGEAADGSEAARLYSQLKPDIVTMDITMAHTDGVKATREIIDIDPTAKIIMCSAMGQKFLIQDAIKAGAMDFLVKPFSPEDLLARLRKVAGFRSAEGTG